MIRKIFLLSIFTFLLFIQSCKKDSEINPFDDPSLKAPDKTIQETTLDPNSFEYCYKNIFKATCANSGCHDGSFEPDFRTMNGAYNTLVYQPVISNDISSTYDYRVLPGNSSLSLIRKRLTQVPTNLIGQGRMPWIDSTWKFQPQNATYIQNIINWIDAGAKDMFGTKPSIGNADPRTMGLMIFPAGNTTTPYQRTGGIVTNPIEVPANTTVDVWAYITDDSTTAQNMVITDIKFSTKAFDFKTSATKTLVYNSPITSTDFWGGSAQFTHKLASFSTASYPVGTAVFVRTYLRDQSHTVTAEIPNNGTSNLTIKYFCIKII